MHFDVVGGPVGRLGAHVVGLFRGDEVQGSILGFGATNAMAGAGRVFYKGWRGYKGVYAGAFAASDDAFAINRVVEGV